MNVLADPRIRILVNELLQYRRAVVALFVAINLAAVLVAFYWPKGYTASTTILVNEKSIIQPLMQGAAVATQVTDRARNAQEVINGRKVMNQVIEAAGWATPDTPASQKEQIINSLIARTKVSNVSGATNLISIQFRDANAERAYRTTKTLADVFIKESIAAKAAESQAAFDFIDQQTQAYHEKLSGMEDRLKDFQIANLDARPGSEGDITTRINALQTRIDQSEQDLREAQVKKKSLESQLSGEAAVASAISREGQYRQRIADLTNQLETLRLSYHDTYPDIVRLRHQIADLNDEIAADKKRREEAKTAGRIVVDDAVINNPMYQQLRHDQSQVQITIDTLNARIAEARQQLKSVVEQGKRVHGGEATLAELTRDYQVTRDIYQDLLRRRENARVSMNMDKENQGLTFTIQEPATLPTQPGILKFWHFIVLGILLGIAAPIALGYALLQIDPRLRSPALIAERHRLPVLVSVPHLWSKGEILAAGRDLEWLGLAAVGTICVMICIAGLQVLGVF